ncbi:PIN domain-like protein [Artomyces pyxidatus]|uniref:PIN domain-like protein n=1 Tax=Artomyces pyxidatus TaxID=48021 RepID=A0ACB8T9P5_9AGAM|nr:PIN domain-like protein [Artomyces pyxidatus]
MGVKSLWDLLNPVGRPVLLETMEGKAMAIDSSIWIYQFQATMRDKEGRALVNAHVLGFLRRICKLLFYGIKPVFVFDGGAPALKRNTITERKKKKSGAAASHAKVAERLLAAQMRREALNHTLKQSASTTSSKNKGKNPAPPPSINENTVYLEDLDSSIPKTPAPKGEEKVAGPSPFSSSKNRWRDHDPYKLPELDLQERVAKVSKSGTSDPRLATEEELRSFIEEMRPEDFDVTSPAFRELPTEVQYEIVGDLRLKSRQTSYTRLQNMLRHSSTPLDFSREQIKNLQQRNSLTQQLLITTDTIGQAHVSIPVRIASERNREYVLMKNTGSEGGWVLGIRDEGTRANPIHIDPKQESKPDEDSDDDDDNMEMEEVQIPKPLAADPDLQEYQREMALAGIGKRRTSNELPRLTTRPPKKKQKGLPLFDLDDDELPQYVIEEDEDPEVLAALQESIELEEEATFRRAVEASRIAQAARPSHEEASDGDDLYVPGRLETALSIANAGPTPKSLSSASFSRHKKTTSSPDSPWGPPILLPATQSSHTIAANHRQPSVGLVVASDLAEKARPQAKATVSFPRTPSPRPVSLPASLRTPSYHSPLHGTLATSSDGSDDDMEEVLAVSAADEPTVTADPESYGPVDSVISSTAQGELEVNSVSSRFGAESELTMSTVDQSSSVARSSIAVASTPQQRSPAISDIERESDWSRASSPVPDAAYSDGEEVNKKSNSLPDDGTWDAAQEMDPQAEEGEFARFLSQVKGKDLDAVRREIDEEIKTLNEQKKVAMRDSEDITQQMISQIMVMLRLFGIPYITAPMEAEAQCAALVQLGLVEGIITDDSDVFLFGGQRVFKNMFNQSKTVECFLLSDLARELGLEREKLIQLAYLLGSDYTEGLPGVGKVVAMELLKEFPGSDGLHKFKQWWQRVQAGRDKPEDTASKFRQRFKKKFKDLYLTDDWPNAAVRDAYYHPTVDDSDEPFKWGLPDLDGLRSLFQQELGWSSSKVEELLLPIIQRMNKRGQAQALNRQGNLNSYFDVASGQGAYAPRKQKAYASKRLQQVVNDFRQQAKGSWPSASPSPDDAPSPEDSEGASGSSLSATDKGKKTRSTPVAKTAPSRGKARGRGKGGARGGARKASRKRKRSVASESADDELEPHGASQGSQGEHGVNGESIQPLAVTLRPRARPAYKGTATYSKSSEEDE